jgi:hypothetical protein
VIAALAALGSAACLATPVHGDRVRAGPFVGLIAPGYDVVGGRFRLHVGGYRVPGGLTQKIARFVSPRARFGDVLVVTGRRIDGRAGAFRQTFARAFSPDAPNLKVFPSIIRPRTSGCWRLTFRSGRVVGSVRALVSNRP